MGKTRDHPGRVGGAATDDVVAPRYRKLSRRRALALLGLAAACLLVVAGLSLMVARDRSPLGAFDLEGRSAEHWAHDHTSLAGLLRVVEVAFAGVGMIAWTTLVVLAVVSRRRYRAAAFAVAVMVTTSVVTAGVKIWLHRDRPRWQDTTDLLTSQSFPSGHASESAALAGILALLAWSFLRARWLSWVITCLAVATWVVVCLDRVLLGRHYPTDVVAGSFLGAAITLLGVVVFDPARMRLPDDAGAEKSCDAPGP